MGIKETASIEFLQSALATEQKRREEAEDALETLLGMLHENGINPGSGIHQMAEERDALQARVREPEGSVKLIVFTTTEEFMKAAESFFLRRVLEF